ncbi:DUF3276 family protein [Candidatus Daviesbacteria bacterium]|nr:DUF3276 family protein [Candidatus Daviesbacteria bacterium]
MEKSIKQPVKSAVLKCGKRTYFFDVNIASNNNKYLKITESQFLGEGQNRKRNSFLLFSEDVKNFQNNLKEMAEFVAAQ